MKKLIAFSLLILATLSMSFAQSQNVKDLTDESFGALLDNSDDPDRLLADDTPIVIDFHATWCGPCKAFAPTFAQVASDFKGKVRFFKVDIDECPGLKELFEIKVVPTLVYIPVSGEPTVVEGAGGDRELFTMGINEILFGE